MMKTRILSLVTAPALLLILAMPVHAQQAKPTAAGGAAAMSAKHQQMMARHKEMMDRMAADNARLDELVTKIDAATTESAKLDAIAAVVKELVSQHQARQKMMGAMHPRMMKGMMGKMQGKGAGPCTDCPNCPDCPMMKGMMGGGTPTP